LGAGRIIKLMAYLITTRKNSEMIKITKRDLLCFMEVVVFNFPLANTWPKECGLGRS